MKQILALLLCSLLLLGCQREAGTFSSEVLPTAVSGTVESTAAPVTVPSPSLAECGLSPIETLEIFRYWGDGKIYTHERAAFTGAATILGVVNQAAMALPYVREPLPLLGITREKAFVTVDFDRAFIDLYSKGDVYEILITVSMTLLQNGIADSVCFRLDGEIGVFGEVFQPEPLVFAEVDSEQFAQIRAKIPYPGLSEAYLRSAEELNERFGVTMDETAMEIMALLARVGKIERDAASPLELEPSRLYYHCILATPYFSIEKGKSLYEPSLLPIADAVSAKLGMPETTFWMGEHLQQTARLLCGDTFVLDLAQGEDNKYCYFPDEGVVTPPHMGGGYNVLPLVLSYEPTDDGYRAEVVYLFESMVGIGPWGIERTLAEKELPRYVQNEAERAEVVIRRDDGDGRLCFVSYRIKG